MRIEHVEIRHGCQHKNFKQAFGPGVILVTGPNGSGKSNLVGLIMRGLTGVMQTYGKREDDVMHGETSGSVKVEFSAGGQKGIVSRSLKSATCKLVFGGMKPIEGVKDVDEAIFQLMGIAPKIVSEIVMAKQGKIEALLFQPPADRARSFQELFGTLEAEKLSKDLQDELANTPVVSKQSQIDVLDKQLKEAVLLPLAQINEQLVPAQTALLDENSIRRFQSVLQTFSNQQQTQQQLLGLQSSLQTAQAKLAMAQTDETRLVASCTTNSALIKDLNELIVTVRQQLKDASLIREQAKQRNHYLQRWQSANEILARAPIDDAAARAELEAANGELALLTRDDSISDTLLRAVGTSYKCPVCTQDVPAAIVEQHKHSKTEHAPRIQALQEKVRELSARQRALALDMGKQFSDKVMANSMKTEAETMLSGLPERTLPSDEELARSQQMVADFDAISLSYNTEYATLQGVRTLIATLSEQVSRETTRLSQLTSSAALVSAEEASGAEAALRAHQTANGQVIDLRTKLTFYSQQETTIKAQLETLRAEEALLDKTKQWRQLMEDARVVLHRDQLPNLVAQLYIQSLNQRLARYLDLFEVPFTCRILSDLSIECIKGGNHRELAERLSGGEKVMLGVAFRFAIYDLFASNLGLLILDEPTVFLDEDHIQSVYALLERVKSYSKQAGLQLIIVTHEKALAGVADRVIQL